MSLHMLEWLKFLKLLVTNVSENINYLELLYIDGGNVKGYKLVKEV